MHHSEQSHVFDDTGQERVETVLSQINRIVPIRRLFTSNPEAVPRHDRKMTGRSGRH